MVWQSSDVSAGDEITSTQYNNLRADVGTVLTSSVPIGTVLMWAGSSANLTTGFLVCDGSAISRTTYADLYTIQGNTFGAGDNSTTFNIPDMRDRFTVGVGTSYTQNAKGGVASNNLAHTHTVANHTHSVPDHTHPAGTLTAKITRTSQYVSYIGTQACAGWTSNVLVNLYNSSGNASGMSTGAGVVGDTSSSSIGVGTSGGATPATNSGGSATQENRPPYIGIIYIIKAL